MFLKDLKNLHKLALIFIFCVSCGNKDTTQDTVKRDRERDQDKAMALYNEYTPVEGIFHGSSGVSDYSLQVKRGWTSSSGDSHVSSPVLVGSLVFYPRLKIVGSEPVQVSFPIVAGNYSASAQSLTLNLGSVDSSTVMSCLVSQSDVQSLHCDWFSSRGKIILEFNRQLSEKEVSPEARQGNYFGETSEYKIEASFRSFYISQGAGQISRVQISADFAFALKQSNASEPQRVLFKSTDGTFDPLSNMLTFNIPGDNQIVVNCKIGKNSELDCQWVSIRTLNFVLRRLD